jgi:anti-sigma-K factor RskA
MTDDRPPSEDTTPGFTDDVTVADYADLAALAKTLTDEDAHLDEPPADLWSRIESRMTITDHEPATSAPSPVRSLDEARAGRRPLPRRLLAAAAAVVAVAVVGGVVVATRNGDDTTTVGDVALVNTDLDPRGADSHGEAKLVRNDDGSYALDVDVDNLPTEPGGFYELWIIDKNVEGMVSLGPLHGSGRYILPTGVDPAAFPVVDISIEPTDGVPTHSGDSILRGVLNT